MFGGVEAGGTKFVCGVGSRSEGLVQAARFATSTPDETIGLAIEFFRQVADTAPLSAIGVGSFGPLDLRKGSQTYGQITATPKHGWEGVDLVGPIRRALAVPVALETDVGVAAIAELELGAARGLKSFVYVTVGTGIGGAAIVNGEILHGLGHPEMGHILVPHDKQRDPYSGICAFHGDCLEGLASGPAIAARWQCKPEDLGPEHEAWTLEAEYLAAAIVNFICILSPERVVLGGGVSLGQPKLLPAVRDKVFTLINRYALPPTTLDRLETFIVPALLGNEAGVLGAIVLAERTAGSVGELRHD